MPKYLNVPMRFFKVLGVGQCLYAILQKFDLGLLVTCAEIRRVMV